MAEQASARNNENPVTSGSGSERSYGRSGRTAGAVVPPERSFSWAGPFWYPEQGLFCNANSTKNA